MNRELIRTLEATATAGSSAATQCHDREKYFSMLPYVQSNHWDLTSAQSIARSLEREELASTRSTPHPELRAQPSSGMGVVFDELVAGTANNTPEWIRNYVLQNLSSTG